eukprot:g9296.t2
MVSDDEKIKRRARSASDNDLLRPRKNDDDDSGRAAASSSPPAAVDDLDDTANGARRRHHSAAGPAPEAEVQAGVAGGLGGKTSKPPGWTRKTKSARNLFFRSGSTPKTQDGESLSGAGRGSVLGKGLASAAAAGSSVARKTFRSESTSSSATSSTLNSTSTRGVAGDMDDVFSTNGSSGSGSSGGGGGGGGGGRPSNKSWAGNFIRSNSFMRSNSLPMTAGPDGRQWWERENNSSGSNVVEEEMEPEPYPPNLERGVKVRKRSMAGKTEIRRLYVRGDTIELVNPEKRMFRSQSKIFPLSELTAVVAQGERSLSLSLGSKGLHLTLADRATKEYLWEHLRKMREQAREQAKASRITRAASIDMISNSQEFKGSKKKVGLFKRSQSYNDASRMAQLENSYAADDDDDDDEEDFLEVLGGSGSSGEGRGGGWGVGSGGSLAARGRKFLRRISTRSGSNVGGDRRGSHDSDDMGDGTRTASGSGRREQEGSDEWSDSDGSLEDDSEDDVSDEDDDESDLDDDDVSDDGDSDDSRDDSDDDDDDEDEDEDEEGQQKQQLKKKPQAVEAGSGGVGGDGETSPETTVRPSAAPRSYPSTVPGGLAGVAVPGDKSPSSKAPLSTASPSPSPETEVAVIEPARRASSPGAGAATASSSSPSGNAGANTIVGKGVLSTLKPVAAAGAGTGSGGDGADASSRSVSVADPYGEGEEDGTGEGGGDGETAAALEARPMKKAATLPVMPRVSLLVPSNRPKGGRKSVQFQVPENEGLDSDTSDSPLPEFLSNPDVRFEVTSADRASLRAALDQLRTALKRATINSESVFTASRSAPGLMPTANASALAGMRMSRMSGSGGGGGGGGGSVSSGNSLVGGQAGGGTGGGGDAGAGGDQGRLGKQFGTGLPSLLACLKGLRRAGTALSERYFFCYVGGFTELISTAEKAWTAISKRSPPDVTAIDRVKAAIIEGTQLAEDHGGGNGDVPHSGARLVVRMVRGLLERDGERLKDASALLWRAHDMLYARMDANGGRRGVFKSSAAPLLPPRRDFAPPPVLCPEPPPHHLPRTAIEERVAAGLLGRVSPWDPPMVITGPPGVGKTVLSSAVARRSDVRRHFRDGIFWLPAGKDATERLPWLLEYLAVQLVLSCGGSGDNKASRLGALGARGNKQDDEVEVELPWGMRGPREGEVAAFLAAHLATRGLTCLLVVDDLWDRESLDQVRDLGFHVMVTANSKGLLWTQQGAGLAATLGSEVVAVDRMNDDDCKLLLKRCSMVEQTDWASLRDSEAGGAGQGGAGRLWVSLTGGGETVETSRPFLQTGTTHDPDYVALYSAGKVCTLKLPDHIRNRYLHLAILPRHVPAPEQMLESLWDTESDDVFDEVLEKLRSHALLQPVTIMGDQGRSGHVTSNTMMDYILHTAAGETVEHAAARMSLYLGRLKVLKSGLGRKAGGKYLAMGRCGLVSCWGEVEKRFGFTALEAYTDSIRAYREKAIASGQGSSLKLAAAVKLLADYLFLTGEKASAAEYYKEALARVEARTEHDRAKPQTQSFSAQVLKGIARCLVAEGQLEEAEERFQKAMGMENARNPGASRAMLEYCQILRQMGEFDRASAVGGQALALVQTGPTGPHSAESAVCVASLAGLAAQQGKPTLSEELYRRSLGVALRVFGSRHPAVAAETNVLAVFLVEHGRNREAEACYRQSMEIWERTLGPYSPELASGLNNLAILLFMEDRPGEAAATFQRSLDIRQRVLPPNSLETAQGLNNLALLYTSQGQDSTAAERLHREALSIREARLGRNHPEVAQTCHNLALLLLKTGPTGAQSPVSARAAAIASGDNNWQWEKTLGDDHPVTEESLQALAAAGGSITPGSPSAASPRAVSFAKTPPTVVPPAPSAAPAPVPVPAPAPAAVRKAAQDSRPTSTDPPPPSLECLSSSDHARESPRELQRQQQREQEQRVKWEKEQAQKREREHELQMQRVAEEKRLKQEREMFRQQNLERQALAREETERQARAAKAAADKNQARLVQLQQRQLQSEQRARQRTGSADSTGAAAAQAEATTNEASPERFHSATGGIDTSAVAALAAAAASAGSAGAGAGEGGTRPRTHARTQSAESPSTAPPPYPYDPVARSFSYRPPANAARDGNRRRRARGDVDPSGDVSTRSPSGEEEDEEVDRVLSLWFDGSTTENHRTKWFAQGDAIARVDETIRKNFRDLVLQAEAGALTASWSRRPRSLVALILVLDQFSRHMFRGEPNRDERVERCDRQALPLAEALLERGWQHDLPAEQHVFALMPLRHSPSEERLVRVMEEATAREERLVQSQELLKRFKKATNRRLQGIQDKAEEGAEILEHFEFVPSDPSQMEKHELVKVLREFLEAKGAVDSSATTGDSQTATCTNTNGTVNTSSNGVGALRTVAVSLSGGVDSMALCRALVHLKPRYGFDVVGIHIDYGNRHESGREADFVEGWCARHGVNFFKRAIAEVRRGVTAREEYEKVAREIRFDAYKAALRGRGDAAGAGGGARPAVMFGHHEGDVEENVLTNLIKGCSILELAGMLPENTVNGVRVWRPMLPFGKDVVYDFAHKFGVPYFKDTTPSWSTRGKLRRQLVPLMEDVFGSGVLKHLSSVARESDDLRELVHRELFQPVWDKAVFQPLGVHLDVETYRGHGLLFWKEVLRRLVHSMGMPMVRDKTLGMFVRDTLQRDTHVPLKDKWVELRKEYVGFLSAGRLYVFRTGVFLPPNTSYGEQAEGTPVPLDGGVVQVGPWRIQTVEGETKPPQDSHGLGWERGRPAEANAPPFRSMGELMGGELSYVVAVPNTPEAALTVQAGARARAPAWRDIDARIRRGIPLVATPIYRDPVPLANSGARMVAVTLKYMGM